MDRWLVRAYTILSIIAILAATTVLAVGVVELRQAGVERATEHFRDFSRAVATIWQEGEGTLSPDPAGDIFPVIIVIAGLNDDTDYLWAASDRFLEAVMVPGSPQRPAVTLPAQWYSRFSRSFAMPDGTRRIVTAVYPVMTRPDLFGLLRNAFITALIIAAVVLAAAILLVLRRQNQSQFQRTGDSGTAPPPDAAVAATADRIVETEGEPAVSGPGVIASEERLEERLNRELERAGFSEQDLAVVQFEFARGERGDRQHQLNSTSLKDFFPVDDLCFEYNSRGAVVMIPNATVDEALGMVERYQRYYWSKRDDWHEPLADFHAGVTARNARLVDAERIMRECNGALKQARQNPGRIVGFKSDPRRYREFLSAS